MFAHRATDPLPARNRGYHESGVGDVRAAAGLVRVQRVNANDVSVSFSNKGARISLKPVSKRVLAGHFRIDRIGVTRRDHLMKNFPDRIAIRILGRTNVNIVCHVDRSGDISKYFRTQKQ